MNIRILTLFPEMVQAVLNESILGRASAGGMLSAIPVNIRDYAFNRHHSVDDYPYGGGPGMLMQAEPIYQAFQAVKETIPEDCPVIYTSPKGKVFTQQNAEELAAEENLIFLCGHYEGVDERVLEEIVTDTYSIGDYVLTGGELPVLVMIDAIARFLPGVLHNADSAGGDSFQDGLLEFPQYSRPEVWHGRAVPDILLSGDHARVDAWRRRQSVINTAMHRPDLLEQADLSDEERELCKKILENRDCL